MYNPAYLLLPESKSPGHDDRGLKESDLIIKKSIQRGLTVITFSAAAADAVGIPA